MVHRRHTWYHLNYQNRPVTYHVDYRLLKQFIPFPLWICPIMCMTLSWVSSVWCQFHILPLSLCNVPVFVHWFHIWFYSLSLPLFFVLFPINIQCAASFSIGMAVHVHGRYVHLITPWRLCHAIHFRDQQSIVHIGWVCVPGLYTKLVLYLFR